MLKIIIKFMTKFLKEILEFQKNKNLSSLSGVQELRNCFKSSIIKVHECF